MKIVVFTSTRADFGILTPIAEAISQATQLELHCISASPVSGSSEVELGAPDFKTWGAASVSTVPISNGGDIPALHAQSLGMFQVHVSKVLDQIRPDLALVLGDRTEALSFAFTASVQGIPLAHMHGGEVSKGALDELHRHAITKLSSLHLPANQRALDRIVRMGENPASIIFHGPFVLDRISGDFASRADLERDFGFKWGKKTAIVTLHGARFDRPGTAIHLRELLKAFQQFKDLNVVFTGPNVDAESHELRSIIREYCLRNPTSAFFVESFGSRGYLSMLRHSDIAVGNSSSLIHEAPHFGIPVLLIGSRQQGRSEDGAVGLGADSSIIGASLLRLLALPKRLTNTQEHGDLSVSTRIALELEKRVPTSQEKGFWDGKQ